MSVIWRFYQNEQGKWRWQQLSLEKTIMEECSHSFHNYETCLDDAMAHGYIFSPAQACTAKARSAPPSML